MWLMENSLLTIKIDNSCRSFWSKRGNKAELQVSINWQASRNTNYCRIIEIVLRSSNCDFLEWIWRAWIINWSPRSDRFPLPEMPSQNDPTCWASCWIFDVDCDDLKTIHSAWKKYSRLRFTAVLNGPTLTMPTQRSDNGLSATTQLTVVRKFQRNLFSHKLALTVKCSRSVVTLKDKNMNYS